MSYRIIVPIFNEQKHLSQLIKSFKKQHLSSLILVNDGSTDNTAEFLAKNYPKVTALHHKINLGKGKALETGTKKAISQKADVIIFMDGDLQHKPTDINRFLRPFARDPDLKLVFGARKIGTNMHFSSFFGNKLLTVTINLLFRYFLNDTQCGFRAFRSSAFQQIQWQASGYSAETEMIIRAAKNRLKYKEIPIDTIYLEQHKGTHFIDGIIIMLKIILWKLTIPK